MGMEMGIYGIGMCLLDDDGLEVAAWGWGWGWANVDEERDGHRDEDRG